MAKRKQQHSEHENAERWLLTYADMITLLMAFFIMLYSMSQLDLQKFAAVAGAVRAQLGGTGVMNGARGVGNGATAQTGQNGIAPSMGYEVAAQLKSSVQQELQSASDSAVSVSSDNGDIKISLPASKAYFLPGRADLTPKTSSVLQAIARTLKRQPCHVRIEGHTCNYPTHNALYPSNWELSSTRAMNAALYLVRHERLPADRVSFMGYADTRPLVPNTSDANRARNRRVEITLHPLTPNASEQAGETAPKPAATPAASSISPPPVDLAKDAAPAS